MLPILSNYKKDQQNILLAGPLAHFKLASSDDYQSDSSGQSVGPPHLRPAGPIGQNCASCTHFDKMGTCQKYNYPVQPSLVCDAYEQIGLDIKKIQNAGPVQPVKAIMSKTDSGPNFGSMKLGSIGSLLGGAARGTAKGIGAIGGGLLGAGVAAPSLAITGGLLGAGLGGYAGYHSAPEPMDDDIRKFLEELYNTPRHQESLTGAKTIPLSHSTTDENGQEWDRLAPFQPKPDPRVDEAARRIYAGYGGLVGGVSGGTAGAGVGAVGGGLAGGYGGYKAMQHLTDKKKKDKDINKEARAPRPDRLADLNSSLTSLSHHPTTMNANMIMPWRTWLDSAGMENVKTHGDIAKNNREKVSSKEAFKAGFLLRCAEAGMTLDQMEKKLEESLEKKAIDVTGGIAGLAGTGAGMLYSGTHSLLNKGLDLGLAVGVGGPLVAGGLGGYMLGSHANKLDPEQVKHEELYNEYKRLASEAKRRAAVRKMQEQSPGSIVQLA